jgi:hypothetical protein
MSRYIGPSPGQKTFFYGFSRTNDGELTFTKVDFLADAGEVVVINDLTLRDDQEAQYDFPGFDTDFFDGRNANHELVNQSLKYEQYKFRSADLYYFIDEDGQLVVRINEEYTYPASV